MSLYILSDTLAAKLYHYTPGLSILPVFKYSSNDLKTRDTFSEQKFDLCDFFLWIYSPAPRYGF